jgi:hypothetical protein
MYVSSLLFAPYWILSRFPQVPRGGLSPKFTCTQLPVLGLIWIVIVIGIGS